MLKKNRVYQAKKIFTFSQFTTELLKYTCNLHLVQTENDKRIESKMFLSIVMKLDFKSFRAHILHKLRIPPFNCIYLLTSLRGQDMTQGEFLSGV